jgi:3-dehydroquinate dehydratase / shikimate dehydrogenase
MLPLKVKTLDDLLTVVRDLPLDGVAVTMPLKQEVLPHLANMDPLTARIGACNTLRTGADGKLYGFNTDVAGIVRPLERRMRLKGARILVLGAGGAARAAVFGLVEQGAESTSSTAPTRKPSPSRARPRLTSLSRTRSPKPL